MRTQAFTKGKKYKYADFCLIDNVYMISFTTLTGYQTIKNQNTSKKTLLILFIHCITIKKGHKIDLSNSFSLHGKYGARKK